MLSKCTRALDRDSWKLSTKSAYVYEFEIRGLKFQRQVPVQLFYKGKNLDCTHRLDVLVEGTVILALKGVEHILRVHEAQLLTYMKLLNKPVGLLINFTVPVLTQGIIRRVL